ncbi:hypothetical protein Vadar_028277 [Vaccinium darrowii]|uniref:Uncharacterized protein n=1 Tax=Vaccinium darrowii TaxID=229202 RepID=A0ACB7YRG1_9ERIC|nr:hypothetical protein Vadar_028277 [Vaccinium darrowii]
MKFSANHFERHDMTHGFTRSLVAFIDLHINLQQTLEKWVKMIICRTYLQRWWWGGGVVGDGWRWWVVVAVVVGGGGAWWLEVVVGWWVVVGVVGVWLEVVVGVVVVARGDDHRLQRMAWGKKKTTLPLKEKHQPSWTVNCSAPARNLRKTDLAAVIFGCNHNTISECNSELLFGLPAPHFAYVKNISPGLPLFLFNYSDRKLYGIFEAASHGQMQINPYAWTGDGAEYTPYPAQVRVRIQTQCQPLLEDQFRRIIADNYYEQRLFWFELDQAQTRNLISLFSSSPVDRSVSLPQNIVRRTTLTNSLPASERGQVLYHIEAPISEAVSAHSNELDLQWGWPNTSSSVIDSTNTSCQQKTWSSLFRNSTTSPTSKEDQDLGAQAPGLNFPHSDQFNLEWDSLSVPQSPWLEGEILNHVALPEDSAMWNYDEVQANPKSGWELLHSSVQQRTSFEEQKGEQVTSYDLPLLDDSNMGWGSSCASPLPDGESQPSEASTADDVTKVYEDAVLHQEKGSSHTFATDEVDSENGCSPEALEVEEMNSSSIQTVVAKLMHEIGGLKVSQLKQIQKISSLEQELVESKAEIQQLKHRYLVLELGSPSSIGRIDDSILIVGGFDGCSWLSALDSYSPSKDTMKSLKPMTFVRSYASQATLNGELYVFGGVDGDMWHDAVESYNPTSDQWVSRPSLNQKKGSLAGASLYGKIFAVGGGNGVECFPEVEMLDMNIGRWIPTQSMLHKRFAPAAADINGTLYVVGGYDGRNYLDSVERFDPREHSWTRLGKMSTRRGCHSLTVLNEKLEVGSFHLFLLHFVGMPQGSNLVPRSRLHDKRKDHLRKFICRYALGGYNGERMVPTVEIFEPRLGSWMMGKPMNNARGSSGAVVLEEKIYVIGGVKDNNEILDMIECYKEGGSWELTNLKAVGRRCYFSAMVL